MIAAQAPAEKLVGLTKDLIKTLTGLTWSKFHQRKNLYIGYDFFNNLRDWHIAKTHL